MSSQLIYTKSFVASVSGDTVLLTPRGSSGRLKLFSVLWNVESTITGEVKLKLGNEIKNGVRNPKVGALYGFNWHPDFMLGEPSASLIVSLPDSVAVTLDVTWREVPDWTSDEL